MLVLGNYSWRIWLIFNIVLCSLSCFFICRNICSQGKKLKSFRGDMSKFHVRGKVVDTVELLRKRKLPWRFDIWPFAIIYAVWIVALISSLDIVDASIVLGGLVAVHVLVLLFTVWSVDFKCFIQYSKVRYVSTLPLLVMICISICWYTK